MALDAADPWSWDAFDTSSAPKVDAPAPARRRPRVFPEEHRLFKVQRDALRAVNALAELERLGVGDGRRQARELRAAIDAAEDAYRSIRSYLDEYVNPSGV